MPNGIALANVHNLHFAKNLSKTLAILERWRIVCALPDERAVVIANNGDLK